MAKKKKQDSEKPGAENAPEFETSFEELQQIVQQLEAGQLTLGQSLSQYELGIKRLRECYLALDQAEQRIKMLVDLDENGNIVTIDFQGESLHPKSGPKRRPTATNDDNDDGNMDDDRSLF